MLTSHVQTTAEATAQQGSGGTKTLYCVCVAVGQKGSAAAQVVKLQASDVRYKSAVVLHNTI